MAKTSLSRRAPRSRPKARMETLPEDVDISSSLLATVPRLLFGLVLAVIGFNMIGSTGGQSAAGKLVETLFEFGPYLILVIGLGVLANGAIGLADKRVAHFADGKVTVTGKRLFKSENWTEDLSAFSGVRLFDVRVSRLFQSNSTRAQTAVYHSIELSHPDDSRTIPLHVTRIDGVSRGVWEKAAKLLGVPAIDDTGSEARVRAAVDVDKSVRELADEGKIEAEWDDDAHPPAGMTLERVGSDDDPLGQALVVTVSGHQGPIWIYGLIFAIGLLPLISGLTGFELFPLIFGGAVCFGVAWFWRWELANPRVIRITRTGIEATTPVALQKPKSQTIQHSEIESVDINTRDAMGLFGSQIALVTDGGNIQIAGGGSKAGLAWLRQLIISAVAKA